jgi:hypothetical protein
LRFAHEMLSKYFGCRVSMSALPPHAYVRYSFLGGPPCPVPLCAPRAIKRKSTASAKSIAPSAKDSTKSGFARTASTIVRIAGKHATSRSRITVGTEPKSICLHIDADARFAAAAGGVARYLGDCAGLEENATSQLQGAVVAACQEAFEYLTEGHPRLEVTFTRHSDRIEVALSHEGEGSPAVGLDTIAGFAAQGGGSPILGGVDRVQYETQGGVAVTRLTKYIGQGAPSR